MIPLQDGILLFYHYEPIENAPLDNHYRFSYYIPRTEHGVGTAFYEMPYALLRDALFWSLDGLAIEFCNIPGDYLHI